MVSVHTCREDRGKDANEAAMLKWESRYFLLSFYTFIFNSYDNFEEVFAPVPSFQRGFPETLTPTLTRSPPPPPALSFFMALITI